MHKSSLGGEHDISLEMAAYRFCCVCKLKQFCHQARVCRTTRSGRRCEDFSKISAEGALQAEEAETLATSSLPPLLQAKI